MELLAKVLVAVYKAVDAQSHQRLALVACLVVGALLGVALAGASFAYARYEYEKSATVIVPPPAQPVRPFNHAETKGNDSPAVAGSGNTVINEDHEGVRSKKWGDSYSASDVLS